MSTAALAKRIAQLEAKARNPEDALRPCHRVIGRTHEELEEKQAALIASGEADAGDRFIHMRIVSPRANLQ
jgi:O6-methylguanine-DNA--protein-cysteine methyltransferase